MEQSNQSKYPCLCDCCEIPILLKNKVANCKHKKKNQTIEMSNAQAKATAELNSQVKILVPKVMNNNFDGKCIRGSVIDFFHSEDFEIYQTQIESEVKQRLQKIDDLIDEKVEEIKVVINDPAIKMDKKSELFSLPDKLRIRKSIGNVETSSNDSFDSTLAEYKVSVDDINEEIAYLKAKVQVLEYEKFRRDNYAPQLVYQALKTKFDEIASGKKSKSFSSSQEINMNF